MTAFVAFVVLAAIPFVPGAEIGFALILLFGGQIASLVYPGMVGAIILSFVVTRLVPVSVIAHLLYWLDLRRSAAFVSEQDNAETSGQMDKLGMIVSPRLGRRLHDYPHLLLEWHGPRKNNNGRLRLSTRQAAEKSGCNHKTAARAFQELQAKGFIVVT